MKELHLVLLTFYLTTVLAQDERRRCGRNEVFDACGSACEPTCRNPNPEVCTLQCVAGCRCRTGFFRNDNNECVKNCNPPTRPPPTRPPTAASCSEMRCPAGYHCEMVEFPCTRQPCASPSPRCVPDRPPPRPPPTQRPPTPTSCSQVLCPPGTRCQMVAEPCRRQPCPPPSPKCFIVHPPSPPPPQPPTPTSCSQARCPAGTRCAMVQEPCTRQPCPAPRPMCIADRPPQPPPATCANVRCSPGSRCEMVAQPCHRQPCPPPSPQCINNGQHRQPRSHHSGGRPPRPTTPPPPAPEVPLPPPNCDNIRCPPGFLCQVISIPCKQPPCSPPTAQCIREQQTQPIVCPKHESWRNCSSRCEPTCDDRNPRCSGKCGKPKCQCDRGFVRNRSGKCVRPSNCPRRHGRN